MHFKQGGQLTVLVAEGFLVVELVVKALVVGGVAATGSSSSSR